MTLPRWLLAPGAVGFALPLAACWGPSAGGGSVVPLAPPQAAPQVAPGASPAAPPQGPLAGGRPPLGPQEAAALAAAGFGPLAPAPMGRPELLPSVPPDPSAGPVPQGDRFTPKGGASSGGLLPTQLGPALPYLVGLEPGLDPQAWMQRPELKGHRLVGQLRLGDRLLVKVSPPAGTNALAGASRLRSLPGVRHAALEGWRRAQAPYLFPRPDEHLGRQWSHQAAFANTLEAWSLVPMAQQGKAIVAVLDSGVDIFHPEFAGRCEQGRDVRQAAPNPNEVFDDTGHGTHVAGIAVAQGDNGGGVAGVAWGAKLLPVKVLDSQGGSDFDVLAGIAHAISYRPNPDTGARVRVINLSLGSPDGEVQQAYVDAVEAARQAGVVVVAAAGNEALDMVGAPASTPGVIAVGATHRRLNVEAVAPYSNRGPQLALVAPGSNVFSTLPLQLQELGIPYGFKDGTSMAAPYVAGLVALLAAHYDPNAQRLDATWVDAVRRRLAASCDDLGPPGWDPASGAGRINARKALSAGTLDEVLAP